MPRVCVNLKLFPPSQARGSEKWGANPPIVKRPHSPYRALMILPPSSGPAVSSQFQKLDPTVSKLQGRRCLARIMQEP